MTLIAVHAVVDIPLNAVVVPVCLRLRMAICTLEHRVIIGIRMAGSAYTVRSAMVDRERRVLRVIKCRVQPIRGAMAVLARRREKLRLRFMSRVRRVVVVGLVAADAGRRQICVVVVDVAVRADARWNRVRSGQWERRFVVIEGRIRPLNRVMTELASGREARVRDGTLRVVEIGLVAGYAQVAVQIVVIVDVAVGARPGRNRMRTRQREAGLRVIELSIHPLNGVVTLLAGGGETCMWHGTLRVVVIGLVARNARGIRDVVVIVDVAVSARPGRDRVRARQRKAGLRVIELSIHPLNGVVTLLAGGRETGVRHRTLRVVVIGLMARNARSVRDVVVVVDVAVGARPRRDRVRARQRKAGLRVIELAVRPLDRVMALLAGSREAGVRHRAFCVVVIGLVARDASGVRDVVVVVDVAIGALPRGHGMRPGKREGGLGVIEIRRLPRRSRVTKFATLRKLSRHVVRILR